MSVPNSPTVLTDARRNAMAHALEAAVDLTDTVDQRDKATAVLSLPGWQWTSPSTNARWLMRIAHLDERRRAQRIAFTNALEDLKEVCIHEDV